MNALLLLVLALAPSGGPAGAGAADGATIQGVVRAEGSLEPIAGATVVVEGASRGATTDGSGYFVVVGLPAGQWTVRASALGYRENHLTVVSAGSGTLRLDFELERRPVELPAVEAHARGADDLVADATPGPPPLRVSGMELKRIPGLAEPDVLRALHTLPAVEAASDYSSALYVRGGTPDQTLITLDGVPLFNPYHLGGIFAAVDPDAVGTVEAYTGALPARLGDRLSGAVDIRTRDGGRDHARVQGGVGLISSRVSADGPLPGGRGSYLLSARRTYVDLFTDAAHALGLTKYAIPYSFTDAHLKLTRDVGRLGRLSGTLYLDREGIAIPDSLRRTLEGADARFDWGSKAAALSYRQPLGAKVLADFRVGLSDFTARFRASEWHYSCETPSCTSGGGPDSALVPAIDVRTAQRDILARADFTVYGRAHELRAGLGLDSYLLSHDSQSADSSVTDQVPNFRRSDRPWTLAGYVEDEWSPGGALALRVGGRAVSANGRAPVLLPRLGARVALAPALSLTVGGGRYAQALFSLRDQEALSASLVAYDVLAGVPGGTPLLTGEDLVVGAAWQPARRLFLRVDAYAKRLDALPIAPPTADPAHAAFLEGSDLPRGRGTARGVELLGRFTVGSTDLSVGYALSSARREIGGEAFPARFDRRHVLNLNATSPLGRTGELSARLALASGQPYTAVVGIVEPLVRDPVTGQFLPWSSDNHTLLLGPYNGARLPGYVRLDLAARKSFDKTWFGRRGTLTPYLQVLNVLGSKNVLLATADGRSFVPKLTYVPQLPILPTLGLEWHF